MQYITNYQYHAEIRQWNYMINGAIVSTLINASHYVDSNLYRSRVPYVNEGREIFRLLGDGNLLTIVDGLPHEFAYKIIQNVNTLHTYIILSSAFTSEFELIKN